MPIIKSASELTERVKLKKTKRVEDRDGQTMDSGEIVFGCWANMHSQMLKNVLTSIGTILEGTLTFIIRYDQDYGLTNNMKVA